MKLNTHLEIDNSLSGKVVELKEDYAKVELKTTDIMRADKKGLVHGGFTFCAADFAAMASINRHCTPKILNFPNLKNYSKILRESTNKRLIKE